MKKLLIFMLVLGLATVANATIVQLSIGGVTNGAGITQEITVPVCTELIIDVHGPALVNWAGYIIINGDPPSDGEWGDAIGPPYTVESGYYLKSGYPMKYAAAGDMASALRYSYAGWGWGYEIAAANAIGPPVGGREFDFMFHCRAAPSDAVITLWADDDYVTPKDTIIVHQIPEPATIALLGLGGLLLRRRK